MLNFDVSPDDHPIIWKIAQRAIKELPWAALDDNDDRIKAVPTVLSIAMDITATHASGCPLRLADLAAADAFNFAHDVVGIRCHLDRSTGKLRNYFTPRYAVPA